MTPEQILTKKKIHFMPKGRDLLVRCINPEHEDKNPSMRIDAITGVFQCWSCGFKGNLFHHFGQKGNQLQIRRQRLKDKISEKIADTIGLEIPKNAIPFEDNWRGIMGSTYKHFEAFQHSDQQFIGRVVFPIRAQSGRIPAFVGRHMTANYDPKYLVYPTKAQLPLFPNSVEPIDGRIIMVEGIMDAINLWDKGLKNVLCTFGTSTLTGKESKAAQAKLELLKIKGVYGVDLLFDGDEAGRRGADKLATALADRFDFDVRNEDMFRDERDAGDLTAEEVMSLKEYLYG